MSLAELIRSYSMRYLLLIAALGVTVPAFSAPGNFHYVGALQTRVKEKPSDQSATTLILAIGRKVVKFERRGEWMWVGIDKAGGRDGWVKIKDLSPTDPDGLAY
jgi:uncharacterized protein YgiM (DUF1202 family)